MKSPPDFLYKRRVRITDRFVMGKRGEAGLSHKKTRGLQWSVTRKHGKRSPEANDNDDDNEARKFHMNV